VFLALVILLSGQPHATAPANEPGAQHHKTKTKGFDACALPGRAGMQDLFSGTPWWWVAMYIGGGNVGSCNNNIDHDWVSNIDDIGYGMLPIWDGKYAPCYSGNFAKMSWNEANAFDEGKAAAGDAVEKARHLGFASGAAIADDQEGYGASAGSECADAVDRYVSGWSQRLSSGGWIPVVYGSAGGSNVDNWWNVANPPDDVWIAAWNDHPSVYWVGPSIPDWHWNDNRYHQYINDVTNSNNGTSITVDRDCARGPTDGTNDALGLQENPDCS
jgi:hypothetical protein